MDRGTKLKSGKAKCGCRRQGSSACAGEVQSDSTRCEKVETLNPESGVVALQAMGAAWNSPGPMHPSERTSRNPPSRCSRLRDQSIKNHRVLPGSSLRQFVTPLYPSHAPTPAQALRRHPGCLQANSSALQPRLVRRSRASGDDRSHLDEPRIRR